MSSGPLEFAEKRLGARCERDFGEMSVTVSVCVSDRIRMKEKERERGSGRGGGCVGARVASFTPCESSYLR